MTPDFAWGDQYFEGAPTQPATVTSKPLQKKQILVSGSTSLGSVRLIQAIGGLAELQFVHRPYKRSIHRRSRWNGSKKRRPALNERASWICLFSETYRSPKKSPSMSMFMVPGK
jgi:hypothetical protein